MSCAARRSFRLSEAAQADRRLGDGGEQAADRSMGSQGLAATTFILIRNR